jgi:hypothetical protein
LFNPERVSGWQLYSPTYVFARAVHKPPFPSVGFLTLKTEAELAAHLLT